MAATYPDVSLSMRAKKGGKEKTGFAFRFSAFLDPLRFVTSHSRVTRVSRSPLLCKNETPEKEAGDTRHFATLLVVSPRNDVWETSAELHTENASLNRFGSASDWLEICFNQSEVLLCCILTIRVSSLGCPGKRWIQNRLRIQTVNGNWHSCGNQS